VDWEAGREVGLGGADVDAGERGQEVGKYPVIPYLNATMIPVCKIQIFECPKISQKIC
jgi:hypothetical protein